MRIARIPFDEVLEIVVLPPGVSIGDAFHPDIASTMLECAEDVQIGWVRNGQSFEPPSGPDLEQLKNDLRHLIDQTAEDIRLKYITPGSGQAMTYAQKAEEARLCLDAAGPDPADYPMLAAEIGITASTLLGVAQVVAAANAQWLQIGAAIEVVRLSAKKAVSEAETTEEAETAAAAVTWPVFE